jgi:predicted nucleic acid-binding protein
MSDAGEADYLVTGDKAGLLKLEHHRGTAILTVRAFLDRLTR